jgi:hypothetical protein
MAMNDLNAERQHYLITPSDPAQRAVTEKIEQVCRNNLISDYKIRLNPGYTTTIACVYVEGIIRTLVRLMRENRGESSINFLDLFTISSENRENDDADKDGNINVKFVPGKLVAEIVDRDYCPVITPEMWKGTIIEQVEKECNVILEKKHRMMSSNIHNYTLVAFCYFNYFFRTLKMMAKVAHDNGVSSAMINFLEMFEAHCALDIVQNADNPDLTHEQFTIKMLPGFQAKLLIKDDWVTESEDEGDDD